MAITNEKDLAKALKEGQSTIEIEGDLSKRTVIIKATGSVAWAVAVGAIGVAVVSILAVPTTGGTSIPLSALTTGVTVPAAVGILGVSTTVTAVSLAVAGGGVAVLNKLRKYKIVSKSDNRVVLQIKNGGKS